MSQSELGMDDSARSPVVPPAHGCDKRTAVVVQHAIERAMRMATKNVI